MSEYMTDPAPLAEADVSQFQNLTLEDLALMHGDEMPDAPATLEMSDQPDMPIEADLALELQAHAGNQPGWSDDGPSVDRRLRQALVMSLGQDEVHLDQKDDLRQLSQFAVKLFQETLPNTMQSLGQFLHAREQSEHLYDKLAELSSRRGSAQEIIQTAKQIENFEKVLQGEQLNHQEISRLEGELEQIGQVIARYREILALAREMDKA